MTQLFVQKGQTWPLSGAASAGTTGLNSVTSLTHVAAPASDLPPGSLSTGYLSGAANSTIDFKLVNNSTVMQVNETGAYFRFWLRAARNATALAADGTQILLFNMQNGVNIRANLYVRNLTSNPGLTLDVVKSLASGAGLEGIASHGGAVSPALVAFDRWFEVCVQVQRSTAGGIFGVYLNRVLIGRHAGMNTDTEIGSAVLVSAHNFFIPGCNGITWQVGCDGNGITVDDAAGPGLRPLHALNPSGTLGPWYGIDCALDDSNANGKHWSYSVSGATRAATKYAAGGNDTSRRRDVWSGAAASTWQKTLIDQIGAPIYSSRGWCSLTFLMVYIPDGSAQIAIKNASGTNIAVLDIASGALKQGAVTLAPWAQADRYSLTVTFGADGTVCGWIHNLTQLNSAQNAWSFAMAGWTPANFGAVVCSGVLGASSQEIDGFAMSPLVTIACVDSLSHVASATVTPLMAIAEHHAKALALPTDGMLLPDGAQPNRSIGMERKAILVSTGRGGQTRASWQTNVWEWLDQARGLEIYNADGGSINELTAVNSEATRASVVGAVLANIERMCDQAKARDSIVWLTTMLRRPVGVTWTEIQMAARDDINRGILSIARRKQSLRRHIRLSDVAGRIANNEALIDVDNIHTTTTADVTVARETILGLTTPSPRAGIVVMLGASRN